MTSEPLRILIVDDNADSARILQLLLKHEGHQVHVEFDGGSALNAVGEFLPDVSLLDLTLPDMHGVTLAEEIRKRPGHDGCALVAVTGHGEETLPSPSPFDGYFLKPLDINALMIFLSNLKARKTSTPGTRIA